VEEILGEDFAAGYPQGLGARLWRIAVDNLVRESRLTHTAELVIFDGVFDR
jgi:hypothetical protein